MSARGSGATLVGRFSIEEQEFWTECECPESLCRHRPDFMRPYYEWIVWDTERDEHAWITHPKDFADSYPRKRDAVAAAQQMLTAERLLDMQGWAAWPSCSRQVGLR